MTEQDPADATARRPRKGLVVALAVTGWLGLVLWAALHHGSLTGVLHEIASMTKLGFFILFSAMFVTALACSRAIMAKWPLQSHSSGAESSVSLSQRGAFIRKLWVSAWSAGTGFTLSSVARSTETPWPVAALALTVLGSGMFLIGEQQGRQATADDAHPPT